MNIKIPSDKVPSEKISISFTWDDNSTRHFSIIAPLFLEHGFQCTFYIVPGEEIFDSLYASGYAELQKKGFEISSHSYSHKYMTSISELEAESELNESVQKILRCINCYPHTFAFPNHDYNDTLVTQARNYHIETRNTLTNCMRFSIKTETSILNLIESINNAISNGINIVFSAHSIITEEEYLKKRNGEGYQPMRTPILSELLSYLKTVTFKADVITFSQSAIRELIKKIATLQNDEWIINSENIKTLEKFHITPDNIISLL